MFWCLESWAKDDNRLETKGDHIWLSLIKAHYTKRHHWVSSFRIC